MGKIVVIGGGEIGRPGFPVETTTLDKEIMRLSGKKHPKLLFLPTASGDAEGYVDVVKKHFGERLGCRVDALLLLKKKYPWQELEQRILDADIIYVGGGNTLRMMRRWRFLGVDELLKQAHKKGVVLSGLSAGGICWFDAGHSDSMSLYGHKQWKYIAVRGLGLVKGVHCPHFDNHTGKKWRKNDFVQFMKRRVGVGIGVDNKCAIEFVNDKYRVIAVNSQAKAYKVYKKKGKVFLEEIRKSKEFRPVRELYSLHE